MDRPRVLLTEAHPSVVEQLRQLLELTAANELVPAVGTAIRGERLMSPRLRDPPV
jgi:hypothetical protein